MDGFKDAWLSIDKDGKEVIATSDLAGYMKKQGNDDGFIRKWMRVLDGSGSGKIDLESFCDTLGISVESMRQELRSRTANKDSASTVQFVSGDMSPELQASVAEVCMDGLKLNQQMRDAPKWIKSQLDNQFGSLWHVVAVNGQFWCYYGHEPGYSFVFRHGKFIFIVYKTPSP